MSAPPAPGSTGIGTGGSPVSRLRLDLVGDARALADALAHALRRIGAESELRIVGGPGGVAGARDRTPADAVVVVGPAVEGQVADAARRVRDHDADLPLIVAGDVADDAEAEALVAAGVTGCVPVDRPLMLAVTVVRAVATARALRRYREAAAAGARRFEAVAGGAGEAVVVADARRRVVYGNASALRVFGYGEAALVGRPLHRLFAGEPPHPGGSDVDPGPHQVDLVRGDGSHFTAEVRFSTWREAGEPFVAVLARDLTPLRAAEHERKLLARAVEQAHNAILITDVDGTLQYVNAAFETITAYTRDEAVGRNPRILKSGRHDDAFYEGMWRRLSAGETVRAEFTNQRKDGSEYRQRSVIFPIRNGEGATVSYVGIAEDVTRERRLEEQFRQAQKMEAIGQLAGGIAHDFNNVLTGILGNAELLADAVDDPDDRDHVADIIAGAGRGADLVRRLMGLSRHDAGAHRPVSVADAIDDAVRMIRRMVPEHIEVVAVHGTRPGAARCRVDEGELHQALINLATNARDAMSGGGRLEVRTSVHGAEVWIEVSDTGHGMVPEVVERLFDPFFTTKERGKGTGLGMVMVLQFVESHGGDVDVESEAGQGSCVRLRLPLDPSSAAERGDHGESDAAGSPRPRTEPAGVRSGNGADPVAGAQATDGGLREARTVLLAEDQPEVAEVARRTLERMGLTVLTATSGTQALEVLRAHRGEVDLVVTDLVMPGGGGVELHRTVASWPDAPRFLVTSGYAPKEMSGAQELLRRVPFLPKPWRLSEFRSLVTRILEEGDS
jgi:PAS domain S-box-containing protein